MQHPDKTFIGRISRGFDFLGYTFTPAGLDVAPQTVERCVERLSRLYEQDVDLSSTSGLTSDAGFGGQRADAGNAENDWLGLNGGSADFVLGGLWLPFCRCGTSFPAFVSHYVDTAAYGAEPQEV